MLTVDEESLGFMLLVGLKKQFEDVTVGSGMLQWPFFSFLQICDILQTEWLNARENNQQINQ